MKRKLLSLILVAAMLASMLIFVPTASAAETVVTASLSDSAAVKVGETVEIDVVLKSDMPLYSYTLGLYYDATKLTLVEVVDNLGKGLVSDSMKNGPAYKEVLGNSPYDAFGWVQTNNTGRDISAGVAVATLVFTAIETGVAEVELLDLQREDGFRFNEYVTTGNETFNGATALVDATTNVTVLPEGYSSESTLVVHEITQEEVDAGWLKYSYLDDYSGVIITGYTKDHDGAVLVLPSMINDENTGDCYGDLPVVGIASKAFSLRKEAAVVIPESVTDIAAAAFFNSTIADYYVLNPDCEIGAGAMGAFGNYNVDSSSWVTGPYAKPIDAAKTQTATIHGAVGSTAATYAETVYAEKNGLTQLNYSADMNLPAEHVLSFGGNDYYFKAGTTATAPGTAVADGKTVIAWTDGTNTYAPGASIVVDKDIALDPVIITAPKTATTVDFKFAAQEADLAMRFTSSMSKADYAKLAELGSVELGMLITPAAYVAKAGAFTKEALDALKATNGGYVDIAIDGYYKETADDYIFAGSLKGFSSKTLAKNPDFAAVLYATVTTDAGVFTVYGDFNFDANQDVKSVAESLSNSDQLGDLQKGWLETLVGKFTV